VLLSLVNPNKASLGGEVSFSFRALIAYSTMYTFFLIPKTKGRSYREINK
jgi:hypothetical protein